MRITSMKAGERFDTSFYIAFWFQLIVEIFGIMHNFCDKSCFETGMRLKFQRSIFAVFEYLRLVSIRVHLDRSEFGSFPIQWNLIYSIDNYWHSQRVSEEKLICTSQKQVTLRFSLNFMYETLLQKCKTWAAVSQKASGQWCWELEIKLPASLHNADMSSINANH